MSFWSMIAASEASNAANAASMARAALDELNSTNKQNAFIANMETIRKMLVDIYYTGNCDIAKLTETKKFIDSNYIIAWQYTVYGETNKEPSFPSGSVLVFVVSLIFILSGKSGNLGGIPFVILIASVCTFIYRLIVQLDYRSGFWKRVETNAENYSKLISLWTSKFGLLNCRGLYVKGFIDKVVLDTFNYLKSQNQAQANIAKLKLYSMLLDMNLPETYIQEVDDNTYNINNLNTYTIGIFFHETLWLYDKKIKEAPRLCEQKVAHGFNYEGELLNDLANGKGKVSYEDGVYEGEFLDGRRHGRGKMTLLDGTYAEGIWKDDLMNGAGYCKYSNGSVYEGEIINSRKSGRGKQTYIDGEYEGEWKDNLRHGIGKLSLSDGRVFEGYFENDKFIKPLS